MTGNGGLLGVAVLHKDWMQVMRHLLPICGFIVGVLTAKILDVSLKDHAVTVGGLLAARPLSRFRVRTPSGDHRCLPGD